LESPGALHEIALLLRQIGGGPGPDPANAVPRFLIPAAFFAALLFASARRAARSGRDRLIAVAAALGLVRELFQFTVVYGSHRGFFAFADVVWFYPPFEHAFELAGELVAGYAFLASLRDERRHARFFLAGGLALTAVLYLATAPSWAAFVRAGATPGAIQLEFPQHWSDLAFHASGTVLLGAVVVGLATARRATGAAWLATAAFCGFFLDHALGVVCFSAGLRPAWFLSPLRHNLHIWAVPALLAVYWWELGQEARDADARTAASERLKSLGLLAGGVAHDFNNLLSVISSNLELALPAVRSPETLAALGDARSAAKRGEELAAQLLAFSGRHASAPASLDLAAVAVDIARLLKPRIPADVSLVASCDPGIAWVSGDRVQLGQVVLNLVVNAAQAMAGRPGQIRVETGLVAVAGRARAFLEVADEGIGMTEAQRARIFDPLFTTRAGGHGLGLAVVDRVVRAHHGAIEVESVPGKGCPSASSCRRPPRPRPGTRRASSSKPERSASPSPERLLRRRRVTGCALAPRGRVRPAPGPHTVARCPSSAPASSPVRSP
jgi:signal transduction histidine kinase